MGVEKIAVLAGFKVAFGHLLVKLFDCRFVWEVLLDHFVNLAHLSHTLPGLCVIFSAHNRLMVLEHLVGDKGN
jgi:hypothetical protein